MFVIQPWAGNNSDEKLTAICIGSSVCHSYQIRLLKSVLFWTQLICEIISPNGLSTCTITIRITCLAHESFNNSMENQTIVVSFFGQFNKVLTCFWCVINKQFDMNITHCCLKDNLTLFGCFLS